MLELQFILINAHFVINVLAAFVTFSVAWLYFDAWLAGRSLSESTKSLGFVFLALSFVVQATVVEQSLIATPLLGEALIAILTTFFRIGGYSILIFGQIIDPIQALPSYRTTKPEQKPASTTTAQFLFPLLGIPMAQFFPFLFPVFAAVTGILYLRKATVGLEYHLRAIAWSLFLFSVFELFSLAELFRDTTNVRVSQLTASFGPLWYLEHIFLLLAAAVLGKWVWGYLIKRLETQLFMIFTSSTLAVFLVTAVFFTTVSLNNIRLETLESLKINANVLQYSIDSKRAEVLSDAQLVAQNPSVIAATTGEQRSQLTDATQAVLTAKKESSVIVTDENGAVLVRAEDPEKIGGSLSDHPLISRALKKETSNGLLTQQGVVAPTMTVQAAVPMLVDNEVVGVVKVSSAIDNPFVDGLKRATDLDSSIYAGDVRSATTFVSEDGKSRWTGITEENPSVLKTVLQEGQVFTGQTSILNKPLIAAYAPLVDVDNEPIGMIFVGRSQLSTLQAAAVFFEQTFLVTALLIVISIFPSFLISKYIVRQISA